MAWLESDRVSIRRWMGSSELYMQLDPRLENAITAVQSKVDGGNMPDSSTETAVRAYLAQLTAIELQWTTLYIQMQVTKAGKVDIDPLRGIAGLKQLGRIYVSHIADALAMRPRRDAFTSIEPVPVGQANSPSHLP